MRAKFAYHEKTLCCKSLFQLTAKKSQTAKRVRFRLFFKFAHPALNWSFVGRANFLLDRCARRCPLTHSRLCSPFASCSKTELTHHPGIQLHVRQLHFRPLQKLANRAYSFLVIFFSSTA